MVRIFILLLLSGIFSQLCAQHLIRPSATDTAMSAPDNFHYVFPPDGTSKNKLFLFFPGTGGVPFFYQLILEEASRLGYHSIGLTYPNSRAINSATVCGLTLDTTCHQRAREEVIDGTDRHSTIEVDRTNCIENRLIKLLQYLDSNFPTEGWDQYLTSTSEIRWDLLRVSGHSQGGGHAALLGKLHPVDRVIMFASNDWIALRTRPAGWIRAAGATPPERFFAFIHERDEAVNFTNLQISWNEMGLFQTGSLVMTDTTSPPYSNSQTLFTRLTPAGDTTAFHGAPVVDLRTPKDSQGLPVFAPVWEYLIDGTRFASFID